MRLFTLKSVLVAVDLGDTALPALRTAARLAPLAGASLHVVHVADRHNAGDEERLRAQFRLALPDGADPQSLRVVTGTAATAILACAVEVNADVVILGPHRGGTSNPLGSTAARVVRNAPGPCLVAATELTLPLKRVVVPVDVSDVEGGALSVALSWVSALRPRTGTATIEALYVSPAAAQPAASSAVHDAVERARNRAHGAAMVDISERVVAGSQPAEVILREVSSPAADLLVMGTHSGGADADLGSVAAAVARSAPCPLLLVPPAVVRSATLP
jgi:nucleotide-binding universal stress UspA family protein